MKKEYIFGILFFGSLWGLSEAILGGLLYRFEIPHASVYLTVIGFSVLMIARMFFSKPGMLTLIAAFAMLYKFLNTPFFACHLLGILLLGVCCDLFFNIVKLKHRYVSTILAIYTNFTLFALLITYIFRYKHWIERGWARIAGHILIGGTLAALACVLAVPLCDRLGQWLKTGKSHGDMAKSFGRLRLATVTTGLWLMAVVIFVMQYHGT
jgi:hypothetical protein